MIKELMKEKRRELFIFIVMVVFGAFILIISLDSVKAFDLSRGPDDLIKWTQDISIPFFEVLIGEYSGSEFFFAKVLLMILLFSVVYLITGKVPQFKGNAWICFIISLVVSIFSIRYLSETELIQGILLPYTTLGIVLITILPFLIFFWFVHSGNMVAPARRLAWMVYAIIFGFLTWSRYDDGSLDGIAKNFYLVVFGAVLLVLMLDRQIHAYFRLWEIKGMERTINDSIILNLLEKLETAEKHEYTEVGKRQAELIRRRLRDLGARV